MTESRLLVIMMCQFLRIISTRLLIFSLEDTRLEALLLAVCNHSYRFWEVQTVHSNLAGSGPWAQHQRFGKHNATLQHEQRVDRYRGRLHRNSCSN